MSVNRGMSRLLLLGCSQAKSREPRVVPACERYVGPPFLVLNKYRRECLQEQGLRVLILSAEYGLISEDTEIPDYDRKMTPSRAAELRSSVSAAFDRVMDSEWDDVGLCLSQLYLDALNLREAWNITRIHGGQGKRLTHLKAWLHRGLGGS